MIWRSSAEVTFRKNSGSLEADGCSFLGCILLFIITVYGKTVGGGGGSEVSFWNRQTFTVRHWTEGIFGYSSALLFFLVPLSE